MSEDRGQARWLALAALALAAALVVAVAVSQVALEGSPTQIVDGVAQEVNGLWACALAVPLAACAVLGLVWVRRRDWAQSPFPARTGALVMAGLTAVSAAGALLAWRLPQTGTGVPMVAAGATGALAFAWLRMRRRHAESGKVAMTLAWAVALVAASCAVSAAIDVSDPLHATALMTTLTDLPTGIVYLALGDVDYAKENEDDLL